MNQLDFDKNQSKKQSNMKQFSEIYKNLILLTQFGLSFITPLLLCLGLCWWLSLSFGIGGWIFIPGFFFGMGGSGMVAYKLYFSVVKRQEKEQTKKKISFNTHE